MSKSSFLQENGCEVSYAAVRTAMGGEPFPMSLVGEDAEAVCQAVDEGIDSHLEACNVPSRGDRYTLDSRMVGDRLAGFNRLSCVVSCESLPVLLRRLFERNPCSSLGSAILENLMRGEEV